MSESRVLLGEGGLPPERQNRWLEAEDMKQGKAGKYDGCD